MTTEETRDAAETLMVNRAAVACANTHPPQIVNLATRIVADLPETASDDERVIAALIGAVATFALFLHAAHHLPRIEPAFFGYLDAITEAHSPDWPTWDNADEILHANLPSPFLAETVEIALLNVAKNPGAPIVAYSHALRALGLREGH